MIFEKQFLLFLILWCFIKHISFIISYSTPFWDIYLVALFTSKKFLVRIFWWHTLMNFLIMMNWKCRHKNFSFTYSFSWLVSCKAISEACFELTCLSSTNCELKNKGHFSQQNEFWGMIPCILCLCLFRINELQISFPHSSHITRSWTRFLCFLRMAIVP